MGRIYSTLESRTPSDFQAIACNAQSIQAATAKSSNILDLVYGPFLRRFANPGETWAPDKGEWAFLTNGTFRGHFAENPRDRSAYAVADTAKRVDETFLPARFFIVIWPDDEKRNSLPQISGDKQFLPGEFRGWAVYADQKTGDILCMQRVEAASSEEVSHRTTGAFKEDPKTAIRDDFERNLQKAIDQTAPDGVTISTGFGSIFH